MTIPENAELTRHAMLSPPQWSTWWESLSPSERSELASDLEDAAYVTAWRAAYAAARFSGTPPEIAFPRAVQIVQKLAELFGELEF